MIISVDQYLNDHAARQRQSREIARVDANISEIIFSFCSQKVGQTFHMEELLAYVRAHTPVAPDSTSRILRLLKHRHRVDYVVVNKAKSQYKIISITNQEHKNERANG